MSKRSGAATVFTSMLILGISMVLSRGWLTDMQAFIKSKTTGGGSLPNGTSGSNSAAGTGGSGFNNGSSSGGSGGGGGGSW